MTWVLVDDQFCDHPKLRMVGPLGAALQLAAICYSGKHLTDGFLNHSVVRTLIRQTFTPWTDPDGLIWTPGMTSGHRGHEADDFDWPAIMAHAGLWDEVDGGYVVHNYDQYQRSRQEALALREARSEAGKLGGQRSAEVRKTKAEANGKQTASKTQAPPPNKEEEIFISGFSETEIQMAEVWDHWIAGWHRVIAGKNPPKPNDKRNGKIRGRLKDGYTVEQLKAAIDSMWASDFHVKNGHYDIELVCRDAVKVDGFLAKAPRRAPTSQYTEEDVLRELGGGS